MGLFQKKRYWPPGANHKSPRKDLQLRFLHRLSRLLNNGYTMIGALEIIQWDHQLKAIASSVTTSLKSGSPLDEALEHVHFSPTITSYLYLVRNNGDLQSSLEKCITMYEQRLVYMKNFRKRHGIQSFCLSSSPSCCTLLSNPFFRRFLICSMARRHQHQP